MKYIYWWMIVVVITWIAFLNFSPETVTEFGVQRKDTPVEEVIYLCSGLLLVGGWVEIYIFGRAQEERAIPRDKYGRKM